MLLYYNIYTLIVYKKNNNNNNKKITYPFITKFCISPHIGPICKVQIQAMALMYCFVLCVSNIYII